MLAQVKQEGAVVALAQGGWNDVRAFAEPAMDLGAEVGDLRVWAASAAFLVTAAAHHGDLARARELAAEVERTGVESGNLQIHGWGLGFLSLVNHLEGDPGEAVRLAEASVAELLRVPDHLVAVLDLGALARAQLRAGHVDAAASTIAHASAEVDKRGFRGVYIAYQLEAAAEYALLGLATGNSAATGKTARRAIRGSLRRSRMAAVFRAAGHGSTGGAAGPGRPIRRRGTVGLPGLPDRLDAATADVRGGAGPPGAEVGPGRVRRRAERITLAPDPLDAAS